MKSHRATIVQIHHRKDSHQHLHIITLRLQGLTYMCVLVNFLFLEKPYVKVISLGSNVLTLLTQGKTNYTRKEERGLIDLSTSVLSEYCQKYPQTIFVSLKNGDAWPQMKVYDNQIQYKTCANWKKTSWKKRLNPRFGNNIALYERFTSTLKSQ